MATSTAGRPRQAIPGICLAILLCTPAAVRAATVTVDGAVEHQTIKGGGTAYSEFGDPYPIPLEDVAAQLYALGLRTVRMDTFGPGGYLEVVNDDADPFHYNWAGGPDSFNAQFAVADRDFRTARTLQDAGIEMLVNPFSAAQWMCTWNDPGWAFDSTIPGIYDELAEYWAAFLMYAQNNHGVTFQYASVHHEPEFSTPGPGGRPWRYVTRSRQSLRAWKPRA